MISRFITVLFVFIIMSLPALAETGDVQGTVYQRSTGRPLAGADVRILETDQNQKTDENGIFQFTELSEGTYTFIVTHPTEMIPTEVSVKISSGATTEVKISLGPAVELETIIVEGKRLPPTISRMEVRGGELLRIPGTFNDTLKGLMTLPSIGIPNDYFGVLYIRGSEPGSNLYYLDRTPLGYPFHWGGLLSTVSSETLEKIDIYAGGYGAEFGLDSQAVLDIHARDSIQERLNGKFNLNILYSEGLLEASIGSKGYISASGRRSYLDLIAGPILEEQTGRPQQLPYFSDYQLKFAYLLGEKHHFTLNAFAATDHFKIVEEDSEFEGEGGRVLEDAEGALATALFKNGFDGQGIHLRSDFTENLTSHLSLTRSFNFLTIAFEVPVNEQFSQNPQGEWVLDSVDYAHYDVKIDVPVWTFREDVSYRLTPKFQFEPGFLLSFSPANSFEDGRFPESLYSEVEDPEELPEILEYAEENEDTVTVVALDDGTYEVRERSVEEIYDEFGHDFYRAEGYVQGRYDPLEFLSVALGVRFDYLNVIKQVSVQPRGSVSFILPNGSNLRFAYGHYEQSPQPSHLLAENGNRALASSLTRHYIMELEYPLSSRTELKFATYYKDARKLVTPDEVSNYLNQGAGYVGGAEVFLRHRIPDRFFGWISYSYTHAERRESPDATYQPYLFDNTHIVSVVGNYSFTPNFEIGAKWQYLSGTSEVPISSVVLIQDPVTRGLNPLLASADEQLSTELAPYHKLDLRVSYKWNVWGLQIGGFLDVLNVYNRKNEIRFIFEEATLDVQGQEIGIEREVFDAPQLPRIVYFGLTLEF
ncbi:MAG: TonB-dependent receptor [Candidatus Poribacteria bacterium]|nr:TonB-dependent receptor [Candidatus Poribacteria bacterium]MYK18916.1 TonB-dependent receptor [Candidatus Poribacteria bacterium]